MRRRFTPMAAAAGLAFGCAAEPAGDTGARGADAGPPAVARAAAVPAAVRQAALEVRADLLLARGGARVDGSVARLVAAERRWLAREAREAVRRPAPGPGVPDLGPVDDLRRALDRFPTLAQPPLPGGVPRLATRLLEDLRLRAAGRRVVVDDRLRALRAALAGGGGPGRPGAAEAAEGVVDAVLAVQAHALGRLPAVLRYLPPDRAIALVQGEAVAGWLWFSPEER